MAHGPRGREDGAVGEGVPSDEIQHEDIAVDGVPGDEQGGNEPRRGVDISMVSRWEAFFQGTDYMQKIREVSDLYPELRSINVVYADLDRFDADMAVYLLEHPDLALLAGKQAIRNLMHAEMRQADINLRIVTLPRDSKVEIRALRAKHVGKMVCVEGLARKATEVRPRITDALFQCLRCGHIIKEPQEGLFFKEPMECYKEQEGCGRSAGATKFKLLTDESHFVDTQKLEIQESPEGLRGGAQPERLTGYLEDDIAGTVAPGDRVILNGILRSVQKGQPAKSTLFDLNLDVISAEFQQHEYEEINITEEDEEAIREIASSPDLFEKIVASISPTIYGYETEKEALALQLFSGVPKILDDGTRIRGDIHILLIGDPGVAKCVTSDTDVMMADGSTRKIKNIVEEGLSAGAVEEIDDGVTAEVDIPVVTFSSRGRMEEGRAIRVWKRTAPRKMVSLRTAKGRTLTMTPTHPLFVQSAQRIMPREVSKLKEGTYIAVCTGLWKPHNPENFGWDCGFDYDMIESMEYVPSEEEWVYDLEVEDSHNYIANGIVSHNSQMLRYMSRLAPRGIYASGKSSSAAGLCVAPETRIIADGKEVAIGDFVEARISSPQEIMPGQWSQSVDEHCSVATMSDMCQTHRMVRSVWRIKTPSFLVEIEESSGKRLTLTPETKIWGKPDGVTEGWVKASDVREGQSILVQDPSSGDFRWSEVRAKRNKGRDLPPFVYDLTVDQSHSFLANGFVVHNTAAAVKDDFGEGRWTLEAGALVLADKGHACIDEMDKMTDQDRSSMHEAMESQTISVAKAGITATLQCRCSLLGAANPKYGRFEQNQYIADQINMPPALLSRFDLIFALTDIPSADRDASITSHILTTHRRGQIQKYEDPSVLEGVDVEKIMEESKKVEPVLDREFFRKYVAYSKRFNPVLSDEAMKIISDFYLKIRKQGEGEGASVPITARQLEAFVRLSEASARARLSPIATATDAERAVRIVEYYLRKIAGEGDRLDFDIIATGTSHSQREQITILKGLISSLLRSGDGVDPRRGVGADMLYKAAADRGIAEDRTKTLLKRLSQSGEIYSPSRGYYKLASEGLS